MWPAEHNKSTITVFEEDNVDGMFLWLLLTDIERANILSIEF